MISDVKSPRPPFSKGGRPLWLAISSSIPLLQRGMEGRDLTLEMLVQLYDLCALFYTNCVAL